MSKTPTQEQTPRQTESGQPVVGRFEGWTLQDDEMGVCYLKPRIEAGEDIYDAAHDSIVARCSGFGAFEGWTEEQVKANARLIASAPALLEALRTTLHWIASRRVPGALRSEELRAARALLAQGDQ